MMTRVIVLDLRSTTLEKLLFDYSSIAIYWRDINIRGFKFQHIRQRLVDEGVHVLVFDEFYLHRTVATFVFWDYETSHNKN